MTDRLKLDEIELEPDYRPSPDEPYMNPKQLAYFRRILLEWRKQILEDTYNAREQMHENGNQPDEIDRASIESERYTELRTVEREQRVLSKIDAALRRIEAGEFGYCEVTGEPIGVRRLEARPIATLSIEAKEAQERQERQIADS